MVNCIIQRLDLAQGLMVVISSRSVLSLHRGLLPKGAHASVFPSIHKTGRSLLLSPTFLSKRPSAFDNKLNISLA